MGGGRVSVIIILSILIMFSGCIGGQPTKGDSIVADNISGHINTRDNLTVHFLDVGQGDSILIQFVGKNILVDGGEVDMGDRVASYLKAHGVSSLDLMVATHPHSDHIGGLITVLKTFPVKQVLDSGQVYSSQTYENFLMLIDQKNIPYKTAEMGQKINIDPRLKIEVLNPPAKKFDEINDNSIVLKVTYSQVSFLLMGDAGKEAEASLLKSNYSLDSDILKVGHHGSQYSSSPAFLDAVSPDVSVIEVGKGNDYGHPAPVTLSAPRIAGSAVYRTDLNGNIDVTTNGESYYITTEKDSPTSGTALPLSISAVQFDAPGDDRQNLNGEWAQVTNAGRSPADMSGWQLYDESGRVYVFPRFTLASGASVKVFSGKGSNDAANLYAGRGSPIWNNNGDTAVLRDAGGNVVSRRSG